MEEYIRRRRRVVVLYLFVLVNIFALIGSYKLTKDILSPVPGGFVLRSLTLGFSHYVWEYI